MLQGGQNLSGGQRSRIALARAVYDYPMRQQQHSEYLKQPSHQFGGSEGTKCFLLDDPCSSADPRVGFSIFSRLFGAGGLLQYAATVMAVDEPSLVFYLRMLRLKGVLPSTKFSFKMVDNGVVQSISPLLFEKDLPPLEIVEAAVSELPAPESKIVGRLTKPDERSPEEFTEPGQTSAEQSYSGTRVDIEHLLETSLD